jgi:GNAT superfamily N-acetyltransferase
MGEPVKIEHDGYEIDDDPTRIDLDAVLDFLLTEAYWGRWRERADIEKQVRNGWRVVGVYDAEGRQVGFSRSTSDEVSDAYLADVYILPEHRGKGLSKKLVELTIDLGSGSHLRWTLFTADAHGLYAQFGFGEPGPRAMVRPGTFTERPR